MVTQSLFWRRVFRLLLVFVFLLPSGWVGANAADQPGEVSFNLLAGDFALTVSPQRQAVCSPGQVDFDIAVSSEDGFAEAVALALENAPEGMTPTFAPAELTAPGSSILSLAVGEGVKDGVHFLTVNGSSGGGALVHTAGFELAVAYSTPAEPQLLSPAEGETNAPLQPAFAWRGFPGLTGYHLQVSTDSTFTTPLIDETGLVAPNFIPDLPLALNTSYYWRVAGINACGEGAFSAPVGFTTLVEEIDLSSLYAPVLVPLGPGQSELRHAYQAVFGAVMSGKPMAWTSAPSQNEGVTYPAGTMAALQGLPTGGYDAVTAGSAYRLPKAQFLYPARIGVFYSTVRDEAGQVVTWEEATFETIFRVYLWNPDLFKPLDDAQIAAGELENFDILILPSITMGYAEEVAAALGPDGLAAIKAWVEAGGTLYAQGDALFLVEAAGLVPAGTVSPDARLADVAPLDGLAALDVMAPASGLTFSWASAQTYVLDDPVLVESPEVDVVARYAGTTYPGTPAILYAARGQGQVILTNAHPSDQQATYPLVFDALFAGMSERAGLVGSLKQEFSPDLPPDVIPAYEAGVPVRVTNHLINLWEQPFEQATVVEMVRPGFTVDPADVVPVPQSVVSGPEGTVITWAVSGAEPGLVPFTYLARTLVDTLKGGEAEVSTARGMYMDPVTEQGRPLTRSTLWISAKMAARLNGDRDIELDGVYPLPSDGYYFDISLTLENKEETGAQNVMVTDVVALLSPVVDVDDQTIIPKVLSDDTGLSLPGETVWVENEVFFYNNANYPLPDGVTANTQVFNLDSWDGVTFYTLKNESHSTVTIPAGYEEMIQLMPDGSIRLPAQILTWDFGELAAYDYLDPAVRYGIFSQELFQRQVSFASDPMPGGVILETDGGSVFTCLGGDPIPYHEYLSSGVITIPESPVKTAVAYQDVWERPHTLDLRTVFYDIVPFPPPEYHAVVNTTFDLKVDWDGDGKRTDAVLEYPSRIPADLHLMVKSHSNFDPTMPPLRKDETLISQGMFKGLGFELLPAYGTWPESWSFRNLQGKAADATVLTTVVDSPAYSYLYFQQELDSQAYEVIDVYATLDASQSHTEGVMKINDGARFVYHQKAVGPSRYEVFDSHVQAVFGLRSDVQVTKQVAPVRVATYEDSIYHFLKVEDPWEPRLFTQDPFIQSYGFGDMAATIFVGGRHERNLLWARVAPGEKTQIRLEVNNNSGVALTNILPVADPPPGITVTLRTYDETTAIEPLFFDFPFLNATTIADAWKGVYYFDVTVAPDFAGELGKVYSIPFTLQGDQIPADFEIPAAKLGIKDAQGNVYTVFGAASDLELSDELPAHVTLQDARIANAAEMLALVDAINYDDAHPGSETAAALYETLRTGITTVATPAEDGTEIAMTLPEYAQAMPWDDSGELAQTLYVILYSDIAVDWSGTALADREPEASFTDYFGQPQSYLGNDQSVEAHGAVLQVEYAVRGGNGLLENGQAILPNAYSELEVEGTLMNVGDDIAADSLVTYVLPEGMIPVKATPAWRQVKDGQVTWHVGDLGPGVRRTLWLTLGVTPTPNILQPLSIPWTLIEESEGHFLNLYAQRYMDAKIGGKLGIQLTPSFNPYAHTFETPVGAEWSLASRSMTPSGRGFLGEFNNQVVDLALNQLPGHGQVRLEFDLYLLRSWDGNQTRLPSASQKYLPFGQTGAVVGPDIWEARVDGGPVLLHSTFANWPDLRQSYPLKYPGGDQVARTGASETGTLGYSYYQITQMDSVYHLDFTFPHYGERLILHFSDLGLQAPEDESWGLDNLRVTLLPAFGQYSYRINLPVISH